MSITTTPEQDAVIDAIKNFRAHDVVKVLSLEGTDAVMACGVTWRHDEWLLIPTSGLWSVATEDQVQRALAQERRRATSQPGGMEVRGIVGMNGYGQLCFFSHSHAEGVPLVDSFGMVAVAALREAVESAPARRVTHTAVAALDPEDMRSAATELRRKREP